MALTLGRLVKGANRGSIAATHYGFLLAGSLTMAMALTTAGAIGTGLCAAPPVTQRIAELLVCIVLLGWIARVASGGRRGLAFPKPAWQVPQTWRYELPPRFTLGSYGYLLGLGVTTNPMLPTIWILSGATIWVSLPAAAAGWALYAAVRIVTTFAGTRKVLCHARQAQSENPDFALIHPLVRVLVTCAVAGLMVFTIVLITLN